MAGETARSKPKEDDDPIDRASQETTDHGGERLQGAAEDPSVAKYNR